MKLKWNKLLLIFIVLLSGCGGGGGDESLTLSSINIQPDTASAGLTITLSGNFSFVAPSGNLNGGSFNYIYDGTTYSITLPAELNGLTNEVVNFSLEMLLNSNTGSVDIPCWLVDNAGHSSNTVNVSFTQLWTRQFGTKFEDIGYGIAIDNIDNVVVTGTTYGDLDGETNLGMSDVYVTKYAPDTSRVWTRLIGSSNTDLVQAIAIDDNHNIYIAGDTIGVGNSFDGQLTVGPSDSFLTKFDNIGSRVWTLLMSYSNVYAVATDTSNNIYITGSTNSNLGGESNAGGNDVFLEKYDTNGNRLWTRLLGTIRSERAYGIAIDHSGNIYLTGFTEGELGDDTPDGSHDVFIAKYDSIGTLHWVTQLGTSGTEWGKDITVDLNGNIYVVGKIFRLAFANNTASGGYDAFVVRLDVDGNTQWIKQFGTAQHDSANSVTTDSTGNVYVTGYLNSVYFNDDNEGGYIFLAKYDESGTQAWLEQDNGGYRWGNQGLSIATDSADNIFLTGAVQGSMDGHINPTFGEDEVFILKYDATGVRR